MDEKAEYASGRQLLAWVVMAAFGAAWVVVSAFVAGMLVGVLLA